MTLVLDASITVAAFFADEQTDLTQDVMRRAGAEGSIVPSLWRLEVANVFAMAVRRKRCDEGYATQSLKRLDQLAVQVDQETDKHAWGKTRDLSARYGLSIYDASYLELAIRRGAVLATRDADLAAAGKKAGIEVVYDR